MFLSTNSLRKEGKTKHNKLKIQLKFPHECGETIQESGDEFLMRDMRLFSALAKELQTFVIPRNVRRIILGIVL